MDTALITGMLEMKVLPEKRVEKDVKQSDGSNFSEFFESSLKDVENKKVESDKAVHKNSQDVDKKEDVNNEEVDELKEGKNKKNKEKKDVKLVDTVNENLDVLINEDVIEEDVLLNKMDVELKVDVNIKDESESVIKVGPQLVETEKIKLNMKDVENKFKEIVENKVVELEENLGQNQEQALFNLERLEKMLNEKIEKNNNISKMDVSVKRIDKSEIEEVFDNESLKIKDVLKNGKKDIQDVEEGSLTESVVNNAGNKEKNLPEGSMDKKEFEGKEGNKEDKFKMRDVNKKESNSFLERIMEDTDVKIEDNFNIKEVNNIQKFENLDVERMDILDQVTEKLEVSLFDNKSEMVIKLKPNDLGKVTVKISIENGVMNAKFLADSIKVKETLESSLNNLKESLKDQGLQVQNLSVSVDSGRSQNQNFEQNNLVYLNNRKDYRINDSVDYEEEYYEIADVNRKVSNGQWMGSTVSFLA